MRVRALSIASFVLGAASLAACIVDFGKYEPLATGPGAGGFASGGSGGQGSGAGGGGGSAVGGGGSAGSGGIAPGSCGTVELLANDFSGPVGPWWVTQGNGATIAQTGGERVVTLPNQQVSWSGFSSRYLFDMRNGRVFIEVPTMVNSATTANAFLTLVYDSNNYLNIVQRAGQLEFAVQKAGQWSAIATAPFDSTNHRWFQFREQAGTMHWETSPDGSNWTTHATRPVSMLFPVDLVQVEHGGSTEGGEMAPGEVHFDNLNGGAAPTASWCPASVLSDDFEDGVRGRAWWPSYQGGGCQLAESGGKVVVSMDGAATDCGYVSSQAFDVTGAHVSLEVPNVPVTLNEHYSFLRLEIDGDNGFAIVYYGASLALRREQGGVSAELFSKAYSPSEDRWWRLSESGGDIQMETSPDGAQWTSHFSAPNPFDATRMAVIFGAGIAVQQPTGGTAEFDNYNMVP